MRERNAFYNTLLDKVKQDTFKDLFVDKKKKVSSFNEKLKEFIELQKNNDEIDLSYIYFREDIKTTFLQYINDKKIYIALSDAESDRFLLEIDLMFEVMLKVGKFLYGIEKLKIKSFFQNDFTFFIKSLKPLSSFTPTR